MAKKKKKSSSDIDKRRNSGLLFTAFFFLGFAAGELFDIDGGVFIGLGLGFLAMFLVRSGRI